eukprot:1077694-Lingulodinium_polyedra.AAC.1
MQRWASCSAAVARSRASRWSTSWGTSLSPRSSAGRPSAASPPSTPSLSGGTRSGMWCGPAPVGS